MEEGEIFPREIYEQILIHVDWLTLIRSKAVCTAWKEIIEDLIIQGKDYCRNWCLQLPKKDLHCILEKYEGPHDKTKWKQILLNWLSWRALDKKTITSFIHDVIAPYRYTCVKISGTMIVCGTSTGDLVILNEIGHFMRIFRTGLNVDVMDLVFCNAKSSYAGKGFQHATLLVVFLNKIIIVEVGSQIRQLRIVHDILNYGVYKNFLCYEYYTGNVVVAEIRENADPNQIFQQITYCRIYTPTRIKSLGIWDGIVTMVTNSNIVTFSYKTKQAMVTTNVGQYFCLTAEQYWTYFNEVIISKVSCYLYITTINSDPSKVVERKFNCMEILGSCPLEVYMHGNIMILTMMDGMVYIYVIKRWSDLDLSKYIKSIEEHNDALWSVDVQELIDQEQRLLFVSHDQIFQVFLGH